MTQETQQYKFADSYSGEEEAPASRRNGASPQAGGEGGEPLSLVGVGVQGWNGRVPRWQWADGTQFASVELNLIKTSTKQTGPERHSVGLRLNLTNLIPVLFRL